jgi:hypothetical protein
LSFPESVLHKFITGWSPESKQQRYPLQLESTLQAESANLNGLLVTDEAPQTFAPDELMLENSAQSVIGVHVGEWNASARVHISGRATSDWTNLPLPSYETIRSCLVSIVE